MAQWYWMKDGQRHGPVDTAELKRLAQTGQILSTDMIWRDGLPKWVPASQANGLEFVAASTAGNRPPAAGIATTVSGSPQVSPPQIQAASAGAIKYRCGSCRAVLESDRSLSGGQDKCPSCGKLTTVPQKSTVGAGAIFSRIPKSVYIGGAALVLLGVVALSLWLVLRDTWERDHEQEFRQMSESAVGLIRAGKAEEGVAKYESLVAIIGGRTLEAPDLRRTVAGAKEASEPVKQRLEGQRREAERLRQVATEEAARKQTAKENLTKLASIESQAKALVDSGDVKGAVDKYQQALDFIRISEADHPEFAQAIARVSLAKSAAETSLQAARRKQQEDEQAKAELARRTEIYKEYAQKVQPFLDAVLRTKSDLEVGVNYRDFGSRVQDMNFQYNKWVASLSAAEKRYPSALVLERVLNGYVRSQKHWSSQFADGKEWKTAYYYSDTMRQFEWLVAGKCLTLATTMIGQKDMFVAIDCPGCGGRGTLTCPHCDGKKACPDCKGEGHICCAYKKVCQVCFGGGTVECPMCGGSKKTPGK